MDAGFKLVESDIPLSATDEDGNEATVTSPNNMKPELAKALKELEQARSRLLRGQFKAAIACAADAVNRIAVSEEVHGYASY